MEYSKFKPTSFDNHYYVEGRENWLLAPVAQNRDSDCLAISNFRVALEMLGGESGVVEVHRFGHWANGWFEIILVNPDSDKVTILSDIESALADYPVLSDRDFSELEYERAEQYWRHCGLRERIEICNEHRVSIFAARREEIPENVDIGYLAE